jgi:hypothetical protein
MRPFNFCLLVAAAACFTPVVRAQPMATVGAPFHSVNSSFFERIGVGWQLQGDNFFARFGGFGPAIPPFGGYQPGAGITGGFAFNGGGLRGNLFFEASQGSRTSFVSQTPMLTLTSGFPGFISDTSISPFVIGFTPVVGGWSQGPAWVEVPADPPWAGSHDVPWFMPPGGLRTPAIPPELSRAEQGSDSDADDPRMRVVARAASSRESTAGQASKSVAEARRLRAVDLAAAESEARRALAEALDYAARGEKATARHLLRAAVRKAPASMRGELEEALSRL